MKRIEVAYPFEAARGALGGKQKLVYNDHDNPAFDAPLGRQYAKNYRTQMIAAKRASDGLNYFQIKKRSAVNNTVQGLVRQAAFAVANYMYAQVLNDKSVGGLLDRMQQALADTIERGYLPAGTTLRQHFVGVVYKKLILHQVSFGFGMAWEGHSSVIFFNNPFAIATNPSTYVSIEIPADMMVKFWKQLATTSAGTPMSSAGYFKVDGLTGLTWEDATFADVISSYPNVNVLDLTEATEGIKMGTRFVGINESTAQLSDTIVTDGNYYTTATPES